MNLLAKLKLTTELDQIANELQAGDLGLMARIVKVRRIDEIIAELTGVQASSVDTLFDVVNKHKSIAVRLRPQFTFDRCVKDYGHSVNDQAKTNALLQELRRTTLKDSDASFLRDQLEIDLQGGVVVKLYVFKSPKGLKIGEYLTPTDTACWEFIEWVYAQKRLIVGPKALEEATAGDNYPANDQPLPDAEQQAVEANQDFEDEAQADLIDPPADEAGAFYQAVIDGAEVDADLIQKAIDYAKADNSHYLLPEASGVIKNKVIESL